MQNTATSKPSHKCFMCTLTSRSQGSCYTTIILLLYFTLNLLYLDFCISQNCLVSTVETNYPLAHIHTYSLFLLLGTRQLNSFSYRVNLYLRLNWYCICIYCKFNHQTTPFYDSYQFFIQFVYTSLFNKLIPVVLRFYYIYWFSYFIRGPSHELKWFSRTIYTVLYY